MSVAKKKKAPQAKGKVSSKFKRGDDVIVIAGKSKGTRGKIDKLLKDGRLIVEGVNLQTHFIRKNPERNEEGGLRVLEGPIHVSNVMHFNPQKNAGDRVYFKKLDDGQKVRCFRSNDEVLDI